MKSIRAISLRCTVFLVLVSGASHAVAAPRESGEKLPEEAPVEIKERVLDVERLAIADTGVDDIPRVTKEKTAREKNVEGRSLFEEKRYAEALPLLLDAGRYGFKRAQYRLYEIYSQGLGGVEVDVKASIGWLGSAATSPTHAHISKRFRKLRKQHRGNREWFDNIVDEYRALYGPEAKGVECERYREEGIRSEVRCFYKVETTGTEDLPSDLGPTTTDEYLRERQQEIPFCLECFSF